MPVMRLGDCFSLIKNGAVISQEKGATGFPITRIETLSGNRFNRDKMGYANIFNLEDFTDYILDDCDILMSHINSRQFLGRAVIYRKKGDESIIHGMNLLRIKTNDKVLLPFYAYYLFQSDYFKRVIQSIRKDAINQSSFSISTLSDVRLNLPSIAEQKKRVTILLSIDNQIETLNSINRNLEQVARQLYDYWFVQFDFPNSEGKPYKTSGGEMVWNKHLKREIPSMWSVNTIKQCTIVLLGGTPDTSNAEFWDGSINWLNSGEVAEFPILTSEKRITEKGVKMSSTVLASKGSVTLSITRHLRPSILAIDACINQSVVAIKETEELRKEYLYPMIHRDIPRLMSLRTGAQQPHINKETVESIPFVLPEKTLLNQYYDICNPIYSEIIERAKQINNLRQIRDELLPMLLNGQISVNDIKSYNFMPKDIPMAAEP